MHKYIQGLGDDAVRNTQDSTPSHSLSATLSPLHINTQLPTEEAHSLISDCFIISN
jgi:hypothetical protein